MHKNKHSLPLHAHDTWHFNPKFLVNLFVSIIITAIFHPFDRAYYVKNISPMGLQKSIWAKEYWSDPWTGLSDSLYHRLLTNSAFFFSHAYLRDQCDKHQMNQEAFCAKLTLSVGATAMTGLVSNLVNTIKHYSINYEQHNNLISSAATMWKIGKMRPFFNGISATLARDFVFSVVYETLYFMMIHHLNALSAQHPMIKQQFMKAGLSLMSRICAASVAITFSSPLNYARNIQYKTLPHGREPSLYEIFKAVQSDYYHEKKSVSTLGFLRKKFMIGTGTLRGASGIASNHFLYDKLSARFDQKKKENIERGSMGSDSNGTKLRN